MTDTNVVKETEIKKDIPLPTSIIEKREQMELEGILDRSTPYALHYKAVHNVAQLAFLGPKELKEAIELGKQYCQERQWRFIQVRPFYHNIDEKPQTEEERAKYRNN